MRIFAGALKRLHDFKTGTIFQPQVHDRKCRLLLFQVIARLRGNAGYKNAYTEKVDEWVAANEIVPHQALIDRAVAAIDRILGAKSELRELWEEGDATVWHAAVAGLRRRVLA